MNRLEYFKKRYWYPTILDIYECKEFTEVVFRDGGEPITIRIYGNEKDGFKIYEK